MKILFIIVSVIIFTLITQVGGFLLIVAMLLSRKRTTHRKRWTAAIFTISYLTATFILIPAIAPAFGRVQIKESKYIAAHSFFYKLANRNYVTPQLQQTLEEIGSDFHEIHPGIKLIHLDANFPFFDKFPLLPHLSHNDGKKIDITLIYEDNQGNLTNHKQSVSGYGAFVEPSKTEFSQVNECKDLGYWQYDYPKYLTLGATNKDIQFSTLGTQNLLNSILAKKNVSKLFIEPHLKDRVNIKHDKIKFHGCRAVRHDDHIHFQIN